MAAKFLRKELIRVTRAANNHEVKIFEVGTSSDRLDQWEVTFFYHGEEAEVAGFDKVLLLIQFCITDPQVPPKVSVVRPRLTGVGLFGGALCFDRQKLWAEFSTDMEAFLLVMRLHLIYQVQARLEEPAPEPGATSAASTASSSSPSARPTTSFSPQERANGFNHIMRTHWDWDLVDIADDGSAVVRRQAEQERLDRLEAERMLQNALQHLQLQNIAAALHGLTEAIDLHPQRSELYLRRGAVFYQLQAFKLAQRNFELASQVAPVHPGASAALDQLRATLEAHPHVKRTIHVSATPVRATKTKPALLSLEQALSEARDGDTLALHKGRYALPGVLLAKSLTLRAHPTGAKVHLTGLEGPDSLFEVWGTDVTLHGLTIERQGTGCCVKVPGGQCLLRACTLIARAEFSMGLLVEGTGSTATVIGGRMMCDEFAAVARQKASLRLERCTMAAASGVIAETASTLHLLRCTLRGPLVYTDFTAGHVEGNFISHSKSLGLSFQGRTEEILVTRNVVESNQSVGALICRGARVTMEGNLFRYNGRTQIEIQGNTDVKILHNEIVYGRVNGILVTASGSNPLIEGNDIMYHDNAGISVCDSSSAQICNNNIHGCRASGVFFAGRSGGRVAHNTITHCAIAGVELEGGCSPALESNNIADCAVGVQVDGQQRRWASMVLRRNLINQQPELPPAENETEAVPEQDVASVDKTVTRTRRRTMAVAEPPSVLTRGRAKETIAGRYPKRQRRPAVP